MFTEITKSISARDYDSAQTALLPLSQSQDGEVAAKADYLLGYIHSRFDYQKRNEHLAKSYLRRNISSDFPHHLAYVLYARVESDINVALNYLNKGLARFPNSVEIYIELFRLTQDKEAIVKRISNSGLTNPRLLGRIIEHLFASNQWDQISQYIDQIQDNNVLDEDEGMYLRLIGGYACLFGQAIDYSKASHVFEDIITLDIDNALAYSHYLGLIYALIKLGNLTKAIEYFDRLPISNSLYDFDDVPQPLGININFEQVYQSIFEELFLAFSQDSSRKQKVNVLYVLYLYHPSEMCEIYRYKKSDALLLMRYLKNNFNAHVAAALYNMRCHFNQYEDAYNVYWMFLREREDPQVHDLFFSEILRNASLEELTAIVRATAVYIREYDYDTRQYLSCVFSPLVQKLHKEQMYEQVRAIADHETNKAILESDCAFECAYAYGDSEAERSIVLYEGIIAKDSRNDAAINNLGVRYEHKGELYRALDCYEKALALNTDKIHCNNHKRIIDLINKQIENDLCENKEFFSLEGFDAIGYSIPLCQKVLSIKDKDMRDLLFRDLRECAIAVVTCQDKMATIMCGSIMEAMLLLKISERGITHYDISQISGKKGANNFPVQNMGLNEFLFVAEKEKMLNTNNYHLGHYIRDYRNVVHPAKEIRMKEDIKHDNVLTMWSVLIRIISELFS